MTPARLSVRFATTTPVADLAPAIPLFHRCIQRGLLEGFVIDVADYRHVPDGPGVLLVGHDVDHGIDAHGVTVTRKRHGDDDAATQLRDTLRIALHALDVVEDDADLAVRVDRTRLTIATPDRRLGDRDTVAAGLRDAVAATVTDVYGPDATLTVTPADDPRTAAEVTVAVPSEAAAGALDRLGGTRAPGQSPWDISVEQLAALRTADPGLVLLDVREESEFEEVNLGGVNVPLPTLAERLDQLDRDAKVVVHCRAGRRGAAAVEQLRDAGFDDAWNVNGALVAWRERIDPDLPVT